jgi:hypothetical protein
MIEVYKDRAIDITETSATTLIYNLWIAASHDLKLRGASLA